MRKTRVLVIDDSAMVRRILTAVLSSDPAIEVVGAAPDAYVARELIKQLNPDVLTLDVEMPRMDGVTFLRNLMRLRPMPVVMVSSLTTQGAEVSLNALEVGAVDVLGKPGAGLARETEEFQQALIAKVKMAAGARVRAGIEASFPLIKPASATNDASERFPGSGLRATDKLVAIGASTGGTEAIREVLAAMPTDVPGMVIAQHIPEAFSAPFARRMNACSAITVAEARDGEIIRRGHAYIAPGNCHLLVERKSAGYVCCLSNATPENRHRPSVDVLFRSVANCAGSNAVGVLLTGMGADGAAGLLEMKNAGALTLVQDEATSVVWGMPGRAVKLGAAMQVLPLSAIASALLEAGNRHYQSCERSNASSR